MESRCHVTVLVNGESLGEPRQPIPDPYRWVTVDLRSRWRLLCGLLRGRLTVEIVVGKD